MIDATEAPNEATPAPKKAKRRKPQRRRAAPKAEPFRAPEEFAGMTPTDCCDACLENKFAAETAQKRVNEIDMMYPRVPTARGRGSPTSRQQFAQVVAGSVMEDDSEWLARIPPALGEEWSRLIKVAQGCCTISGGAVCAHPFKAPLQSALQRDPEVFARYQRAKKALRKQRLSLEDAA